MGKYIKRKNLTPDQYWMANKTMTVVLMVCYIIYAVVELSNHHLDMFGKVRIGMYVVFAIGNFYMLKVNGRTKRAMLIMAFSFIFSYIPLYGLVIAFQKYNPGLGFSSPWIGFDNFIYLFSQPGFVRTIWNSLYIAVFKIIGGIVVPVLFSLLLNEIGNQFIKRFFQTLIYIPNFISWVIMAGIMRDLLATDGLVNNALSALGLSTVNFLGDPGIFPWTCILSDIWKGKAMPYRRISP